METEQNTSATELEPTPSGPPAEPSRVFTQEEVNRIVGERVGPINAKLKEANEKIGALGEAANKATEAFNKVAELELRQSKLLSLDEEGLPLSLADSIAGTTLEDFKANVKKITETKKAPGKVPSKNPMQTNNPKETSTSRRAAQGILRGLKGEN